MRNCIPIIMVLFISHLQSFAQVAINLDQSIPHPSAMLDVKSLTKGFLPPRMNMEQMNSIVAPSNGLLVYNTTMSSYYWFDGSVWIRFETSKNNIHTVGDIFGGGIVFYVYDNGQHGLIAAKVCTDYSVSVAGITYGDWYLPSLYELNLLYQQKNVVGGFSYSDYWSSTENNAEEAWSIYFYDGFQSSYAKNNPASVRPIRVF